MDALVKSAIAHWAPRFVANGVALTDFEEVTTGVASWSDWCAAWCDKAAQHEAMGREALANKKFISAGERTHLEEEGIGIGCPVLEAGVRLDGGLGTRRTEYGIEVKRLMKKERSVVVNVVTEKPVDQGCLR